MNSRAQIRMLPDGRRLHMHDGPIDLIVEAFGEVAEVEHAYRAACDRFPSVLDELCEELATLRQPWRHDLTFHGPIACRMVQAVAPHGRSTFITPMAAVAGAVAEEILASMTANAKLAKAYVNNGGDIALHLASGEEFSVGMVERPDRPSLFGTLRIHAAHPIRGIATSGWRGRSFSLGIADAVTVLARSAADADAAATIIANAIDLPGSEKIGRVRARELAPDSDLGKRLVTQSVAQLSLAEIHQALDAGAIVAGHLWDRRLIATAALRLQGETRLVGADAESLSEESTLNRRRLVHA
ncbi:MAG: UPF0280 family protein [Candidatus Sulfotelmatobacter sp.]